MRHHERPVRAALIALLVSLPLIGCRQETGNTLVGTEAPDGIVSVSAGASPLPIWTCSLGWTVTITADDQMVVAHEWSLDADLRKDALDDPDRCTGYETSETVGQAPAGTFERVVALVSAGPYGRLDHELYPSAEIMDGTYDSITVRTADEAQTKGGHMVGSYGPQAFEDVYDTLWDAAAAAGLWGS